MARVDPADSTAGPDLAAGPRGGACCRSALALGDLVGQLRDDREQVTDDAEVGELEDRRLRVLVDHDDGLRRLHAGPVLDGPGDAVGDVQLRGDGLAGLADLELVGVPAGVGGGTRGADSGTERVGQRLDDAEALGPAHATPTGDHDGSLGEVGTTALGLHDPIGDARRLRGIRELDGDVDAGAGSR